MFFCCDSVINWQSGHLIHTFLFPAYVCVVWIWCICTCLDLCGCTWVQICVYTSVNLRLTVGMPQTLILQSWEDIMSQKRFTAAHSSKVQVIMARESKCQDHEASGLSTSIQSPDESNECTRYCFTYSHNPLRGDRRHPQYAGLPSWLIKSRWSPTDMCTDQANLNNPSLRIPSVVILGDSVTLIDN